MKVLNDTRKLGKIYIDLTSYILAKCGSSGNITRITSQDCNGSFITRTLFLLKTARGAHLKSQMEDFLLEPTSLKKDWMN